MSDENEHEQQHTETHEHEQPLETAASAYAVTDEGTVATTTETSTDVPAASTDVSGGVDDEGNPLRTLFMSGFPNDVKKREIHNLFRFAPGFEAVTLNSRGRAPVAFATFHDQASALSARSLIHATRFDPDLPMDLRVDLAKTNSFGPGGKKRGADGEGDQPQGGTSEKRARYEPSADPYAANRLPPSTDPKGITTLFVANLGMYSTEEELRQLFAILPGFRRLKFNQTKGAPVCFVDYTEVVYAQQAQQTYQGYKLPSSPSPTGLRIEFAKNSMGGPPDPPMRIPVPLQHGAYAMAGQQFNPYGASPAAFGGYGGYPGVGIGTPFIYDPNAGHHPYK